MAPKYVVRVDPDEIIAARLGPRGIGRKVIRDRPRDHRDHRDSRARRAGYDGEVLFPSDE